VATAEVPIRSQLLDNGSPPNQIPASKLPHHDRALGHHASRSSVACGTGKIAIRNALKNAAEK
jgi:hypothetical protein